MALSGFSEIDNRMLKLLLSTGGKVRSSELSKRLGIPLSTVQRRRKRMEDSYLVKYYSLDFQKFGLRRIDILISTTGGATINLGRALLKRSGVIVAARTIGEHTIDLKIGALVRSNAEVLDLLEEIKSMDGVRDAVWTETVELIGRNDPPSDFLAILEGNFEQT